MKAHRRLKDRKKPTDEVGKRVKTEVNRSYMVNVIYLKKIYEPRIIFNDI